MTAGASPRPGAAALRALRLLLVAGAAHCTREGDLGGLRPEAPCDASCDDACVELATDPRHCGACGVVCSADEVCRAGACAWPWPARWRPVAQTQAGTQLDGGWEYSGGGCLRPTSITVPDGGRALSLRADWGQLATIDPSDGYGAVARAWVWRMQIDPPIGRAWSVHGFARTRTMPGGALDYSGVGFVLDQTQGERVQWWVDGEARLAAPFTIGRMVELRVEVSASRTRARALLDGTVQWEGATDASDWSEREGWSLNVFRAGGFAGCDQGRFLVAELRVEVSP